MVIQSHGGADSFPSDYGSSFVRRGQPASDSRLSTLFLSVTAPGNPGVNSRPQNERPASDEAGLHS